MYACVSSKLEVPRVRLSISGVKSGTNALRAKSEFPGFVRLEIYKPWKMKLIASPDSFQNCATPSTVGTVSFFEAPLHGTNRAGHEMILYSARGTSDQLHSTIRVEYITQYILRESHQAMPGIVAHVCGDPLSCYTCRATRVAADFLRILGFFRCSSNIALHPPPRRPCRTCRP